MITLYDTPRSGHCHKVRLVLSLLGLPYDSVETVGAARRSQEFLALNPLGQVPVLVDGDVTLADSNAICVYLLRTYGSDDRWLPRDPVALGLVQRWLSIAAGELYIGVARVRAAQQWGADVDVTRNQKVAARLFAFMEQRLADHDWLALERASLADLAMYSYMSVADEGGYTFEDYPAIRRWLERVEALPGFVAMPHV